MPNWKTGSQVCAGVGVAMSAAQVSLLEVLPQPYYAVYGAIQTAIIALGLYLIGQTTVPIEKVAIIGESQKS